MRNWSAIGPNFDKDQIARAKNDSGECLDVDVVTNHDDGRFWKLLEALLYQQPQTFRFLIRKAHVFKKRTQRWINNDRPLF